MCSVVGYVGKRLCRNFVLDGLSRLEYRGYDSAGFVCLNPQTNLLSYVKSVGGIANLHNNFQKTAIDGYLGMGHTRWSTHGVASTENAHPHFDCFKEIAIVHNGIIENHHELKKQLLSKNHVFRSQTDTEIIAHLLENIFVTTKTLKDAAIELVRQIDGAYAIACLTQAHPNTMLIARKKSPLCIGAGEDETFIASDPLAFAGKTNKVLFLPDESFALISPESVELFDFSGNKIQLNYQFTNLNWNADLKSGHEHFMLKEIYEQNRVIQDTVNKYKSFESNILNQMHLENVKNLEEIHLLGCGTSWHAALIAKFFFEDICKIKTTVHLASELRYQPFFHAKNSLAIALTQSGETADTLDSVRFLNSKNIHTVALTNVESSTITRETNGHLLTYAGPEIAVASTKAFSSQLTVLYWLANKFAVEKKLISKAQLEAAEDQLLMAAELLEFTIEKYKKVIIENLAPKYSLYKNIIFLGRHISYPLAMEAALKLKEISYIFTNAYPAGELKHGTLALIDATVPVFMFSHLDNIIYHKLVSNAQEVKARSGQLVVFAYEGQNELIELADYAFIIPISQTLLGPLVMTGLMQYFVYHIAKVLDRPIDKPRNLAKSVTVE